MLILPTQLEIIEASNRLLAAILSIKKVLEALSLCVIPERFLDTVTQVNLNRFFLKGIRNCDLCG